MAYRINHRKYFKSIALIFVVIASFGFLSRSITRAQAPTSYAATVWSVDVDFTDVANTIRDTPTYTAVGNPTVANGGCPGGIPPGLSDLTICKGDTVRWRVHTNKKQDKLVIYQGNLLLYDENNAKTLRRRAEDGAWTLGGKTDPNPTIASYEYCVATYDKKGTYVYIHDPKIIIGNRVDQLVQAMSADANQLQDLLQKKSDVDAAEKDVQQLLSIIQNLKKDLHLDY